MTAREPLDIEASLGRTGFVERRGRTGILLVHGLTGTPTEMRQFAKALARHGFTVACPVLAGHCDTVSVLKASRWPQWYRSVEQAFDTLARECDAVFVSGLSMGALLALMLAARKGAQVAGVIALSATFFYDGWNMPRLRRKLVLPIVLYSPLRHFLSWNELAPYGIKCERTRALVTAILSNRDALTADKIGHFRIPGTVIRESERLVNATRRALGDVSSPTLFIHSTEDDMASVKNVWHAAQRLGSRHVECHFIEDSYHVLTLDRRRDDVVRQTAEFCRRLTSGHASRQNSTAAPRESAQEEA